METGDIVELSDPTFDLFWTITTGGSNPGVWLSTDKIVTLLGGVEIDDNINLIDSGKSWKWLNETNGNFVTLTIEKFFAIQNFSQFTVGCWYIPDQDTTFNNFHDTIIINSQSGTEFAVLQTNKDSGALTINCHTAAGDSDSIGVTRGEKYWVNLLFDSTNLICKVGIFDKTTFEHIAGSPVSVALATGQASSTISFGRTDGHTGNPTFGANNYSWVAQIVMDRTGQFPLKPGAGTSSAKGWANGGWGN